MTLDQFLDELLIDPPYAGRHRARFNPWKEIARWLQTFRSTASAR